MNKKNGWSKSFGKRKREIDELLQTHDEQALILYL